LKDQCSLPEEGLAMIRYHSFYPSVLFLTFRVSFSVSTNAVSPFRWHREGAYRHLTNEADEKALAAVKAFNPYDLYSKSDESVDPEKLKPYYQGLIAKFFPDVIEW
jgi:inositol oxygenase